MTKSASLRTAARKSQLLSRTALGTALMVVAAAAAGEAGAQSTTAGNIGSVNLPAGGSLPSVSAITAIPTSTGSTSTITLNAGRTVLNWNGFNLTAGNELNFVFAGKNDIALNKLAVGTATIDGKLNSFFGPGLAPGGGNVWFYAPGGVVFGANARVNVGGLLATTADITNFGSGNFTFEGAAPGTTVNLQAGAQIVAADGTVALVAPVVITDAASSIVTGAKGDVLIGAAQGFQITFAEGTPGDLDLFSWIVPADGSGLVNTTNATTPIDVNGAITAGSIYMGSVSRAVSSVISLGGLVTANGAAADGQGNIILSAGGGLLRPTGGAMGATSATSTAVNLTLQPATGAPGDPAGQLDATNNIRIRSSGDITASAAGTKIDAVQDVELIARSGTVDVTTLAVGDDYTVRAQNFVGDALKTDLAAAGTGSPGDDARNLTIEDTAGGLTIGTVVAASGDVTLISAGNLTVSNRLTGGRDVTLTATGGTATVADALAGPDLNVGRNYSVTAADFGGGDVLTPNFTTVASNNFSITDTAGAFSTGVRSAPGALTIETTAGALNVTGLLTGATVNLKSATDITQTVGSTITAGTLTANATAGAVNLDASDHAVGTLGASSGAGFRLRDAGGLIVSGSVDGKSGGVDLRTSGGSLRIGGDVTSTGAGAIALMGGSGILLDGGDVTASGTGAVNFNAGVNLLADTVVTGGQVGFNVTLNGGHALTVNGATTFAENVGGSPLTQLTVNGATTLNANSITAAGLSLGAVTVGSGVAGSVALSAGAGTLTVGAISDAGGGANALSLTGGQINASDIGSVANPFGDVAFNGATRLDSTIVSSGAVSFGGALTLGAGSHSITGADVTFVGAVNAAAPLVAADLSVTATGLGIDDNVVFLGSVGATNALASLAVTGKAQLSGASYNTTGNQVWNGAVELGAGSKTFDAGTGGVSFNSTLSGAAAALTVNAGGDTTFGGVVGGAGGALVSLTTSGGGATKINTTAITTTGAQTFGDNVVLGSNTTLNAGSGAVTFGGEVRGTFDLLLQTTGSVTFGGDVGVSGSLLRSVNASAVGTTNINGGGVFTTQDQSYGAVVLGGAPASNKVLQGRDITLPSVVGAGRDLELGFTGETVINGATGIRNLRAGNGGLTKLSGTISTTGTQTYEDAVTLTGATTLTSTGAGANGDITLNGITGGGMDLTVTSTAGSSLAAPRTIAFNGVATGINALVASAGIIDVNAALSGASINMIAQHGSIDVGANVTATASALLQATAATGTIVGNGRVTGAQVLLNAGAGIGVSPANRVSTAASTLTASGGTGGVFISELDGVGLQSNGPINNAGASYDLTADGTVEVLSGETVTATAGTVALTSGAGSNIIVRPGAHIQAGGALGDVVLTSGRHIDIQGGADFTAGRDIVFTAENRIGGISAAGTVLTAGNSIDLTAAEWGSGILDSSVLQEGQDLSITDTAGAGSFSGLSAFRRLTIETTDGDLTVANVSAGENINLTSSGTMALSGTIDADGDILTLIAGGAITQASDLGDVITASRLTGSSVGGADLSGVNEIAGLDDFTNTTSGEFRLNNDAALAVIGDVSSAGGVRISALGNLTIVNTLAGAGTVTGTGTFAGGAGVRLESFRNVIVNGTVTNTAGDVSVQSTGSLPRSVELRGDVTAGGSLVLGAAGITQFAGVLDAGTLTVNGSGGAVSLTGANKVDILGSAQSSAAGFSLTNAQGLTVNGPVNSNGGAINLTVTGSTVAGGNDLSLNGNVNAGAGTVTLVTDTTGGATGVSALGTNDITQSGGGITAAALAGVADGLVTLNSANNIGEVSGFTANQLALRDGGGLNITGAVKTTAGSSGGIDIETSGPLNVQAEVSAGASTLRLATTGDAATNKISLDAAVTAGTLDLDSAGAVEQTVAVTASTLTGTNGGPVALGLDNAITNLGAFSANGLTLVDVGGLTVTGAVTGGSTPAGLASITTKAGGLTVADTGSVSATEVRLTTQASGDIAINGAVTNLELVQLTAAGNITQASTGVITATTLQGSAGGSVDLDDATNAVTNLGTFTASGGSFTLNDGTGGLNLTGDVTASGGVATIATAGGALALNGRSITGSNVTLTGVGITQATGGIVTANAGTVTLDGSDGAITLAGALNASAPAGAVRIIDASDATIGDITTGATGTVTLGAANGDNISGALRQTAGTKITTGTLSGAVGGNADLDNEPNAIAELGVFGASAGFALRNAIDFKVIGEVSSGAGNLSLAANGFAKITLNADINGAGQEVNFTAGTVDQTGGIIKAKTLTAGNIGVLADLQRANEIEQLGAMSVHQLILRDVDGLSVTAAMAIGAGGVDIQTKGGDLVVASTGNLSRTGAAAPIRLATDVSGDILINGLVNAGGGRVNLVSAGQIDQDFTTGKIQADTLTGISAGRTRLFGLNAVRALDDFTSTGFWFRNGAGLKVIGKVDGRTGPVVIVTGGDLEVIDEDNNNTPDLILGGTISLTTEAGSIVLADGVNAGTGAVTLTSAGNISQTAAGAIKAGVLNGSAAGSAALNLAANNFTNFGGAGGFTVNAATAAETPASGFTATGIALTDTGGLAVNGAVNGRTGTVSIETSGLLTVAANGSVTTTNATASAVTLRATAGGIDLNGAVNAGGGTANLLASGAIGQQDNTGVTAGALVTRSSGGTVLDGNNAVPVLADMENTGAGGIFVRDLAGSVTTQRIVGGSGDTTIRAESGSLTVAQDITAGDNLTLFASNALTSSAARVVTAVDGDATLTADSINFGTVNAGDVVLATGPNGVTLTGARANVGNVEIRATNDGADITVGSLSGGNDVILRAGDNIGITTRPVVGRDYDIVFRTFSGNTLNPQFGPGGRDFLLRSTNTAGFDFRGQTLAAPRDVIAVSAAGITAGAVNAGRDASLTAQAGGISLNADVRAGDDVFLNATSAINQPGGIITAPKLTTTSSGGLSLAQANEVAELLSLTNAGGGGILVNDAASSVTVRAVSGGTGDVEINATNGTMTVDRDIASNADLRLTARGALSGQAARAVGSASLRGASVSLAGELRGGRDGVADATAGSVALTTVTAGRDATLSATGGVTFQTAQAERDAATTTSGGSTQFATLTAGRNASLRAGDAVTFTTAQAGGDLTAQAGTLTGATARAGGSAALNTIGALSLTRAEAGQDLTTTNGSITITTASAGRDAALTSSTGITLGTLSAGRDAALRVGTGASADGSVTFGSISTGRDLSTLGGSVVGDTINAGRNVSLNGASGDALVGSITVGGDLSVVAGFRSEVGRLTSTGANASLEVRGEFAVVGAPAAQTPADTARLTLNAANPGSLRVSGSTDATVNVAGAARVASISAGRTATVTTRGGDAVVTTASAGDTLSVTANDGSATLRNATMGASARSLDVRATGAGGDAVLGADAGATAGASERLTGPSGLAVRVQGDRDATLNVQNGFDVASLTAGRAATAISTQGGARVVDARAGTTLAVRATQGQVTLGTATTTGTGGAQGSDITAVGRGVSVISANAAGSVDLQATAGDATVELVNAGGDVRVDASRDAHVRNATLFGTVAGNRELRVNGGRNAALGRAPGGALAGSLGQGAADRTAVVVAAGTGNATVDLPGDAARLTQVTSASGDVSIQAPGAIVVRNSGGVAARVEGRDVTVTSSGSNVSINNLVATRDASVSAAQGSVTLATASAGRDLTAAARMVTASGGVEATGDLALRATAGAISTSDALSGRDVTLIAAGGGITVAGSADAKRALTVDTTATATLNNASGDTALVRAADLSLQGALKGRVTTVESRTGALNLGDGTGSSAGMTIDRAEFARIQGRDGKAAEELNLYAGATNGPTRGDIAVGDLTLDGAKVTRASLKAGPDATVRLAGKVEAATDGSGALVIGESAASGGWTPKSIEVTGSIGEATTTTGLAFTGVKAVGSVELNAIGDVLIGTQQFITAIQSLPANGINVARQIPAGILAQGADVNRIFVASGTMTLRADGRVVQQSTSRFAERPVGVFLSNPGKSSAALTFGRTGGPSASGSLTPGLIDLSMSMNDRNGTLLFGQIVAASPSVSLGGLTPNNQYRINGCTIGGAGTCTVLSEKLVDVAIENLIIENLLEAQDAPLLTDPTITGAGNEEIWRGGELAEEEEEEE